jgi:hypothetical protein
MFEPGQADSALSRDEEERLISQAAAGSVDARRRVIDAYAELATLFALEIRPRSIFQGEGGTCRSTGARPARHVSVKGTAVGITC